MQIIPFDTGKVPASIAAMFGGTTDELVGNSAGGGFPIVSIKGKVFHITRGDEKTLVCKPGEDDPAASIEVVIVRANPNQSKVYYSGGFVEGESAKPDCYSNNGVEPEADAQEPQAKKCAVCVHNQWGARTTDSGKKGKACADSRRLAIATVETPADPMLLRVPAASMKGLQEYAKQLSARGVPFQAVVTRIGFDYSVAHPALTFKPVGLIADEAQLAAIKRASEGELVGTIIGIKASAQVSAQVDAEMEDAVEQIEREAVKAPVALEAPVAAAPAEAPKPKAPKAAKPPVDVEDVLAAAVAVAPAAKAKVVLEGTPASAGKALVDLESQVSGMLDDMDFDD